MARVDAMHVAAVILAAGSSSRLGHAKQLVMLGGERLLDRMVRVAKEAGCASVVVVLGSGAEAIAGQCRLGGTLVVRNEGWEEGVASSIRLGVAALQGNGDGAILMTCDQPAVSAEHLRALMAAGDGEPVASFYAGWNGIPAYFPAKSFTELECLRGDVGAREMLRGVPCIALPHGELDVDTPEALALARKTFALR